MDDFGRQLREMLNDRVAAMPAEYDAPPVLLKRARRRRATKLTALAVSMVVVAGSAAGVIAQIAGRDDTRRVATTAPASTLPRPGVPTVACAKDYPDNIRGTRVLPPSRPRVPTAGDPAVLSTLVWFAESVDQNGIVLGPASWSCQFPVGEGGMVIYDPEATAGAVPTVDEAPILLQNGHLRCRPTDGLTAAACDTIVTEYSARLESEARVHTVQCPSTTDVGEEPPRSSTAATTDPRAATTAADQLPTLQFFSGGSDPRYVVLGPDSWSCLGRSTESGSSRVVYDPNATPGQVPSVDSASIALENEVWEDPSGARLVCSVFDDAAVVEFTSRNYPDSCLTSPAPGRTVTRVSEDVATFVDANGDRGAGWMILPLPQMQEPGRISVLTCRPSAELTVATCDTIIADYAARLDDGNPPPS